MMMNREYIGGLFFFCVGLFALINSATYRLGSWSRPGGGVFPLMISILLCIVGILIFLSGKGKEKVNWGGSPGQHGKPWQIILLSAAMIMAFERVGFMVASSLYLFGLFLWVGRFRVWTAMGLSVVLTAASWYFFGKILALSLPVGFLNL